MSLLIRIRGNLILDCTSIILTLTSVDTNVSLELSVVAKADLAVGAAVLLGAGLALGIC